MEYMKALRRCDHPPELSSSPRARATDLERKLGITKDAKESQERKLGFTKDATESQRPGMELCLEGVAVLTVIVVIWQI